MSVHLNNQITPCCTNKDNNKKSESRVFVFSKNGSKFSEARKEKEKRNY